MPAKKEVAMFSEKLRWVVLSALVGTCALTAGCYAELEAEPVSVDGYAPQYYDGYVVYYDTVGRPYYYNGGGVYYVPPTYREYGRLTRHYQTYREPYVRWQGNYGTRYRSYRRRR